MIGQFLSNTNESATVSIFQNFLELNKALQYLQIAFSSPSIGTKSFLKCSQTLDRVVLEMYDFLH